MKNKNIYLMMACATLATGCANDEILADGSDSDEVTGSAIVFGSSSVLGQTRATTSGSAAANKLNEEFVVFGTKHYKNATDQNPFTNYVVKYIANSAGTTESNSNNWEYVGQTPYASSVVSPAVNTQTVKYWDYSTTGYTFTAFSGKDFLKTNGAKVEKVTDGKTAYDNGYSVTLPSGTTLDNLYFSDLVSVERGNYNKPVVLTFRNFGAKVRVGFYETVPGYTVKIDKFYYDSDATAPVTTFQALADIQTDGSFVAALQNVNKGAASNTVNVTYYSTGDNANQTKVNSGSSSTYQYTLTLGKNIVNKELGTSASAAIFDTAKGAYTTVYPNLDNTNPMLMRCDYTLTADDGSGETIKVTNARVTVPTQFVQWKSNYAYTYLFKISNNTNGTTGGDKEGLFPITFDAVTVDATDFNQETTTTMATNDVTSYAKDGYKKGKDIYFVDASTSDTKVIAPTAIGDNEATKVNVYKLSWSNTDNTTTPVEGDVIAYLTGLKNGLTMTAQTNATSLVQNVPSADGTNLDFGQNGAVKFTPTEAGTYVYVYCTTKYVAPTYEKLSGSSLQFDSKTTYYHYKTEKEVYYTASGINKDNFDTYSGSLYTQTKDGTAGSYDVKVITVSE